ncbi:MAG TPA: hypothetical protein VN181_06720, partial [Thermoanaerobaculia bacterium]|nr:hypothetical protein [Thermoanaerobaculia bacterium]
MKRLLAFAALAFCALSAFAGITYRFDSVTTGTAGGNLSAVAKVEGANMRLDFLRGDGVLFRDKAVAVSRDAGKTFSVTDPEAKTFYVISSADLGGLASLLRQFGRLVTIAIENQKVSVREGGDGGVIEGFPTRRRIVDASYDIAIDAMGQKIRIHNTSHSEHWLTDRIDAGAGAFFQGTSATKSGIDALDKLLAAQLAGVTGFPLKQVTTMRMKMNGQEMVSTTTV